ncbi:monovalent cation/H(+) antiporter subunit G [Tessaracoccus sp. SD287]|uniref:monovalent cation/H(+) antiporter subunit G n=1 Tax=Tessaracoccus sp. SD287 TaxID=2782008 RepID=UPI001A97297A
MTDLIHLASAFLVLCGTFFCLSAAVGIVRFPDVITRLHAATKPQVFGLILILTGVALRMWDWKTTLLATLIVAFQILTAPVSAHMVSRTAYRLGLWDADRALVDELGDDLEEAGFTHPQDEEEGIGARQAVRWKPAQGWVPPTRPRPTEAATELAATQDATEKDAPEPGAPVDSHQDIGEELRAAADHADSSTSTTEGQGWDDEDDEDDEGKNER